MTPADRLIVAFDHPDLAAALRLANKLRGLLRYAKIGSILFTAEGPRAIERFRALGFEVFLDLKFHDIPSTVEKSCRAAARHGVFMLTVHASGDPAMLEAAADGARSESARLKVRRPRVVGVTVLTSEGSRAPQATTRRVVELARRARQAGLDGVVASAQEAAAIRRELRRPFLLVCPGIRLPAPPPAPRSSGRAGRLRQAGPALVRDDQRRISTPAAAIAGGADLLVVGRPITEASDPRAAAAKILEEITQGACCIC